MSRLRLWMAGDQQKLVLKLKDDRSTRLVPTRSCDRHLETLVTEVIPLAEKNAPDQSARP
jgi:hypothetical protein